MSALSSEVADLLREVGSLAEAGILDSIPKAGRGFQADEGDPNSNLVLLPTPVQRQAREDVTPSYGYYAT
jgi:hypothetical protein